MKRFFPAMALAALLALPAGAQEPVGTVSNTFTLFQETLRQITVFVTISVTYPDNLGDEQYIDLLNVGSDVQGFLRGYPNRQASLEVYAANAATQLLKKYPQMTGAAVTLSNSSAGVEVTATRAIPTAPATVKQDLETGTARALKNLSLKK